MRTHHLIHLAAAAALLGAACTTDSSTPGSGTDWDALLGDTVLADGYVPNIDGLIGPDGIVLPDGAVIGPDGAIIGPDGVVIVPDGAVIGPDGAIIGPDGTVITPDSLVPLPDGEQPAGTVQALQVEAEASACDADKIQTLREGVTLTGVVVTAGKFDAFTPTDGGEALDGYYVADATGGPWAGILVTIPRVTDRAYVPGDTLDLAGDLVEFYCNTQMTVTSHTLTGHVAAPAPIVLAPEALAAEAYEGVLVQVAGVQVVEALTGGVYRMTGGFVVDHDYDFFLKLDDGVSYTLTGAVKYAFDEYRLMPRSLADISFDFGTNTTIADIQSATESVDCTEAKIANFSSGLAFDGVVTVGRFDAAAKLDGYFVSDGTQEAYSGIFMVVDKSMATDLAVGTKIGVLGQHVEYYCVTEIKAAQVKELGEGTVPAPVVLDKATLCADLEAWEGVVVEIADVTVGDTSEWSKFGQAEIDCGMLVDAALVGFDFPEPKTGDTFAVLRGVVHYAYDKYRIQPRTMDDVVGTLPPVDPGPEPQPEPGPEPAAEAAPEMAPDAGSSES